MMQLLQRRLRPCFTSILPCHMLLIMNNDLQKLRDQLDDIDAKIIHLLGQRFAVTQQVGELKKHSDMPPVDPSREARQMERISQLAQQAKVNPVLAQAILRLIIDEVVRNHQALRSSTSAS